MHCVDLFQSGLYCSLFVLLFIINRSAPKAHTLCRFPSPLKHDLIPVCLELLNIERVGFGGCFITIYLKNPVDSSALTVDIKYPLQSPYGV